MPVFNNIHQLNRFVEMVTMPEIAKVAEIYSEQVLIEKINDTVYRRKPKPNYDRTFSMRDSVRAYTSKGGSQTMVETYPDTNRMKKSEYPSFYLKGGKLDNRDSIVKWLDQGHGGYYKGQKINYKPTNFMAKAMAKLEKTLVLKIVQQLKLSGYEFAISTET